MREPLLPPGGDTADHSPPPSLPPHPTLPQPTPLPAAFPSLSQTKCGGNKCAFPPRVTGRSRLKIQFETAGFEHGVRILVPRRSCSCTLLPRRRRRRRRRGKEIEAEGKVVYCRECRCATAKTDSHWYFIHFHPQTNTNNLSSGHKRPKELICSFVYYMSKSASDCSAEF